MSEQKAHIEQGDRGDWSHQFLRIPQLVQVVFLIFVSVITLSAFNMTRSFVKALTEQEYESVIQANVEHVVENIAGLKRPVESLAQTLLLHDKIEQDDLMQIAENSFEGVERFDHVIWLHQSVPGAWKISTIYTKEHSAEDSKRYAVGINRKLLSFIRANNILSSDDISVHTDIEFVTHEIPNAKPSTVSARPFALMKTIKAEDPGAGILVATGTLMPSLTKKSFGLDADVSIREIGSGYNLYSSKSAGAGLSVIDKKSQRVSSYEFPFAGRKWEMRTTYVLSEQARFLSSLPPIILVCGFMIAAFGLLYIRSNTSKSIQVSKMYKKLEQKTLELQGAVQKRERLNKALSQTERENRAIIDAVSDIIFEVDTEGSLIFLSAAWHKVTGFDPEQAKGMELFKMLHSHDQEQQRKDFQLMVRGQKQSYRFFARLRTSDGTFRAVEVAFSMMRQDENNRLRIAGTITDVEERRRAERALSEAEKKYRAIVENAAGGIYQLTPEGLYLSANPAMARILGYSGPEDLLREVKNANERVYVDARERHGFMRELERRGSINSYEVQIYRKDGQKIWVNENVRVVKDENNNVLYYEGSFEDITLRKRTEIAMRDAKVHSDLANRAKSEFLANMSHELRTPLNAIIGFSEIIKNEVFGKIEQRSYWEYANDIHDSGQSLLSIINEILDISKIEAGERQLNEGLIDLHAIAQGCIGLLSNKIESNHLTIANDLQDVPQIIGEELAIKQILMNLLSNAIKFTPADGRVNITADMDAQGQLRVSVTDTGVGLDADEMAKALSPFGQVDNDLSRSGSGTGLGLTLVDALIKLHGGEFELFSQKGIGTTATLIFPVGRVTVRASGDDVSSAEKSAVPDGSGEWEDA